MSPAAAKELNISFLSEFNVSYSETSSLYVCSV